jgi:phage shock protein A
MADQDQSEGAFNTFTARLIRREALRRAAQELATTTPAGLESALARISADVTADAIAANHPRLSAIGKDCC